MCDDQPCILFFTCKLSFNCGWCYHVLVIAMYDELLPSAKRETENVRCMLCLNTNNLLALKVRFVHRKVVIYNFLTWNTTRSIFLPLIDWLHVIAFAFASLAFYYGILTILKSMQCVTLWFFSSNFFFLLPPAPPCSHIIFNVFTLTYLVIPAVSPHCFCQRYIPR